MRLTACLLLAIMLSCKLMPKEEKHKSPPAVIKKDTVAIAVQPGSAREETYITGRFVTASHTDTIRVVRPVVDTANEGSCTGGECAVKLIFSDKNIAPITVPDCIGGRADNVGDLDGDGKDEIGFYPERFTSCWKTYFLYTVKNNKSGAFEIPSIYTHCDIYENVPRLIEKARGKKGYVTIREAVLDTVHGGPKLHERLVKIGR